MSAIPRFIRLAKAVRETCEMYEIQHMAAEVDAGFDAGEWSGPAHARIEQQLEFKIAGKNGVTQEEVYGEIQRQSFAAWDDGDAIGQMMGENR